MCGLCGGGSGNQGPVPSRQAQLFLPPLVMNRNTDRRLKKKKSSSCSRSHRLWWAKVSKGEASGVSQVTTSVSPAHHSLNLHLETTRPAGKSPTKPATPRTELGWLFWILFWVWCVCLFYVLFFFVFVRGRGEAGSPVAQVGFKFTI